MSDVDTRGQEEYGDVEDAFPVVAGGGVPGLVGDHDLLSLEDIFC